MNDPSQVNGSVSYSLDPVGNRLSDQSTLGPIGSTSTTFNSDDQSQAETYDSSGDTISTGGNTYAYNSWLKLTSMNGGQVALTYNGLGQLVSKSANGITTQYLIDDLSPAGYPQVVEEIVGGQVARKYTYGLERISELQMVNNAPTASFYQYDGRGTVRMLTNSAGAVTDTYEYDAFGNLLSQTGSTPNNYLYRGEQWDPDLSLYYLRARYYNPVTGRFMTQDPYAGETHQPASLHRYRYANGNPVNYIDPSGRDSDVEMALSLTVFTAEYTAGLYALAKSIECVYNAEASAVKVLNGPQTGATFEQLVSLRLDQVTCGATAVFAGLGLGGLAADGFGALLPEAEPLALESEVPPQLTAGQEFEAYQLDLAGLNKNSTVLRPTPDQVNSATFRAVVGNPAYTPGGQLRGTIFDSVDNGYFEIKGGSSPLDTSYQLRLQTYFSLTDGEPFTIITSRPIAPSFQQYLDFWGVNVVSPVE